MFPLDQNRPVGRRDFLRQVSAVGFAAGTCDWANPFSASANELRSRDMACILLWMQGGPSQFETFSPKPGHKNGGETRAISTSVPGIHLAENLPHCAKVMGDLAVIRSMTSKEENHQRATYLLHHGYLPSGDIQCPTLGSNVAHQIGEAAPPWPSYVRIGSRLPNSGSGGCLGTGYDPLILDPLILPSANGPNMGAFDLRKEPKKLRASYGEGDFASGCILARRLIEHGATFVEVVSQGWDMHQNVFGRTRQLAAQIDQPMATLITDLKRRGLLEKTLVIWMGEFGRAPRVNAHRGRDHYPEAFSAVLAGGGIQGGQVVGKTNEAGTEVVDRPVSVNDLFRTIYRTLKIDADHENFCPTGRSVKLVNGGNVVKELFG